MNFLCQREATRHLLDLASADRHSILIDGVSGSGKTYLAMQYANMLNIADLQSVEPKVSNIKEAIDACLQLTNPIVLVIENLDTGVPAASYALLKFLEEPLPNVYIVVTCRSIKRVPETIISRSTVVSVAPPINSDVSGYAISKNKDKYMELSNQLIWKCVRSFKDADEVMNMSDSQLSYFTDLQDVIKFQDTVSNIIWKLSHYNDNSESPIELVIRYIMELLKTVHIQKAGVECLDDLASRRIASHAVLAKFVFEAKYCE